MKTKVKIDKERMYIDLRNTKRHSMRGVVDKIIEEHLKIGMRLVD